MARLARLGILIFLTALIAGCEGVPVQNVSQNVSSPMALEDVRAIAEADLMNREWNVPNWYKRSIQISPASGWTIFSHYWASYTFIYTGLLVALGLLILMCVIYAQTMQVGVSYFWIVVAFSFVAIPALSFISSAISGHGVPWHFSMFCGFILGAFAPLVMIAVLGLSASVASASNAIGKSIAHAGGRAGERRRKRERERKEREANVEQERREKQRSKQNREVSVYEKIRNVELAVGELSLCAPNEKSPMEREFLHTVMELTGHEKEIRSDPEALKNLRNVTSALDRLGYDKNNFTYLKLVTISR